MIGGIKNKIPSLASLFKALKSFIQVATYNVPLCLDRG